MTVSFGYDLNGNLISDGQKAYGYDEANELTHITVAGQWKTEFVYDGLGRRRIERDYGWQASQWVKTNETRCVCDGYLPMQERDASGNVLVTYTRGLDLSGTFRALAASGVCWRGLTRAAVLSTMLMSEAISRR